MTSLYEAMEALKQLYLQRVQDIIKTQNKIKKSEDEAIMTEIKNETAKQNQIWNTPYNVGDEVFYYSPSQKTIFKARITEIKWWKDETNEIKWRFAVRFTRQNGLIDDNDATERLISFDKDVLVRRFKIGKFCS